MYVQKLYLSWVKLQLNHDKFCKIKGNISESCTITIRNTGDTDQLCVFTAQTFSKNPEYVWVLIPDLTNPEFKHRINEKNKKMLTWTWQRELFAFNCPSIEVCDKFEAALNDIRPRPKAEDVDEQGSKMSHTKGNSFFLITFPPLLAYPYGF